MSRGRILILIVMILLLSRAAAASFVTYTERDEWEAAVGDFDTIDFLGFPAGTVITDQYADLGVLFPEGNDIIDLEDPSYTDGAGLRGFNPSITMEFDLPQMWLGIDYRAVVDIELYSGGQRVFSQSFTASQPISFAGILSSSSFDSVRLLEQDEPLIDNISFGVPAPGTLLVGVVAVMCRRRRRARH